MSSINLGRVVGYSAYEIAVQNGFVGTEAEWLASLKGNNGADGQDGSSATIQVGTVSTGAAGSDAVVTNVGTSSAAVFNFTIPQGPAGSYTAGANITISNGEISAVDTTYTAGTGIAIDANNEISVDTNTIATQRDLTSGLAEKQDLLTAGEGISIRTENSQATTTTIIENTKPYNYTQVGRDMYNTTGIGVSDELVLDGATLERGSWTTDSEPPFALNGFEGRLLLSSPDLPDQVVMEYDGVTEKDGKDYLWIGDDFSLTYSVDSRDAFVSMSIATTNANYNETTIDAITALVPQPIPQGYIPVDGTTIGFNRKGELEAIGGGGSSLPTIAAGDAGKVLTVNSLEDGVEWAAAGGGGSGSSIRKIAFTSKWVNISSISAEDKAYLVNMFNNGIEEYPCYLYCNNRHYYLTQINGQYTYWMCLANDFNTNPQWKWFTGYVIRIYFDSVPATAATVVESGFSTLSPTNICIPANASTTGTWTDLGSEIENIKNNYATKAELLPACPTTTDGTYVLKATVASGAVTYSWVAE